MPSLPFLFEENYLETGMPQEFSGWQLLEFSLTASSSNRYCRLFGYGSVNDQTSVECFFLGFPPILQMNSEKNPGTINHLPEHESVQFCKTAKNSSCFLPKLTRFLRTNGFAGEVKGWFSVFFCVRVIRHSQRETEEQTKCMPSILLKAQKGERHLVPNLWFQGILERGLCGFMYVCFK